MITKENSNVDINGIYIPFDVLIELQQHYRDVKSQCEKIADISSKPVRLCKYYDGKIDILNDFIALIKEERKNTKVAETTII